MRIVYGGRRSGKTYRLIEKFRKTGGWLVVRNFARRSELIREYMLGLTEQRRVLVAAAGVLTFVKGEVQVDDAEAILGDYLGGRVNRLSMTGVGEHARGEYVK